IDGRAIFTAEPIKGGRKEANVVTIKAYLLVLVSLMIFFSVNIFKRFT
ncbi:MAG: hypothetical protein JRI44_12400, partial [Deltaproteobacteria bacterium]|nr:hypothetical protein [Deltaproteobacteria bacterium]